MILQVDLTFTDGHYHGMISMPSEAGEVLLSVERDTSRADLLRRLVRLGKVFVRLLGVKECKVVLRSEK